MPSQPPLGPPLLRTQPVQERAQETVSRILDAATAALLDPDASTLRITGVARRSGLTRQVIYRYFPGIEAIIAALMQRYLTNRMAEFRAMLATLPPDATAEEACATVAMAIIRAASGQALPRLSAQLREMALRHGEANNYPLAQAMGLHFHEFLQTRGLLHNGRPSQAAALNAALALASVIVALLRENPAALNQAETATKISSFLHQAMYPPSS